MKRILPYGTFDMLHIGHIRLLKRAKQYGDYLVVGLSTDEFNAVKGKKCVISYEQRKELLESIKFVDEVFPEDRWEQKTEDVLKYQIDTFIMGDDWLGKFDFLRPSCEVIYLPRTEGISTTQIKTTLRNGNTA